MVVVAVYARSARIFEARIIRSLVKRRVRIAAVCVRPCVCARVFVCPSTIYEKNREVPTRFPLETVSLQQRVSCQSCIIRTARQTCRRAYYERPQVKKKNRLLRFTVLLAGRVREDGILRRRRSSVGGYFLIYGSEPRDSVCDMTKVCLCSLFFFLLLLQRRPPRFAPLLRCSARHRPV